MEGSELASKAARLENATARATSDAARSTAVGGRAADEIAKARAVARAKKYAEIGERTRLKAVASRQKLATFLTANIASRALIPPSIQLLVKEVEKDEKQDFRGQLNTWLQSYMFYIKTVHREERT